VCESCGNEFPASAIQPNERDDYPCPFCGRLRLEKVYTGFERLRALLIEYNRH
jgi:hypothetical protein